MEVKKFRWSKTYEAGEGELIELLASKNVGAERWVATEHEEFKPHIHALSKRLWCAEGSITFTINGTKKIPLQAGDALDIPSNTVHEALAGFAGCICYEYPRTGENPQVSIKQ